MGNEIDDIWTFDVPNRRLFLEQFLRENMVIILLYNLKTDIFIKKPICNKVVHSFSVPDGFESVLV